MSQPMHNTTVATGAFPPVLHLTPPPHDRMMLSSATPAKNVFGLGQSSVNSVANQDMSE